MTPPDISGIRLPCISKKLLNLRNRKPGFALESHFTLVLIFPIGKKGMGGGGIYPGFLQNPDNSPADICFGFRAACIHD